MTITDQRSRAVRETVEKVRLVEAELGVTREALDSIRPLLTELASRSELFPPEDFANLPGRAGTIYHLAEDADGRFALYGSAGVPGKAQPPHNHTTWAVISGVFGEEHNVAYRRTDDRSQLGKGALAKDYELTVQPGNAIAFLPDDFHTIEVAGGKPSLHLHLYGKTLEDLPERIYFGASGGGAYQRFMAKPEIFSPRCSVPELRRMIADGGELALLDVREEGVHARGHPFLASSCALSRLELLVERLVPRHSARVLLIDDDETLAQRAAAVMRRMGYRGLSVLAGGVAAWQASGHEIYSGMHVPSKAFGEYVEHRDGTPRIGAAELKAKLDRGEDVLVVDSRPLGEFRLMNIPGALDCPGAELVYRVPELARDPETLVVVNCAGRTRSIIGAQSLINAGLPNRVLALKNGTMGWHLAGLELEHGSERMAQAPSAAALAAARAAAARVAQRFGIRRVGSEELARFAADPERTLYLYDVRSPEEYAAGHIAGARNAPGGQLVQATDTYLGIRNARVALVDAEGVRAVMTASWLLQMGWPEVVVVDAAGLPLVRENPRLDELAPEADTITPQALRGAIGAEVLDFATSLEYRAGHIPGAEFAIRARLGAHRERLGGASLLVCTSPDGVLARYAARELKALVAVPVKALSGGTRAWRASGLPMESGATKMLEPAEDVYYKPYDHVGQVEQAMQDYLDWEVALVEKIKRDPDCKFVDYPAFENATS